MQLFTKFTAIQEPAVPRPGTPVRLKLTWPEVCQVESVRVRFQTSVHGPWQDSIQEEPGELVHGDGSVHMHPSTRVVWLPLWMSGLLWLLEQLGGGKQRRETAQDKATKE